MRIAAAALPFFFFAGCASTQSNLPVPSQEEAKAIILEAKPRLFVDPGSVRDARISTPTRNFAGHVVVCLEANARNRMGGYTGLQRMNAFLKAGRDPVLARGLDSDCVGPWMPFPELDGAL